MKAALEDDHVGPAGGLLGELDPAFDDFCAAVAKEERVERRRNDGQQLVHQLQHRLVVDDVGLAVDELGGLLLDGLDDARVAWPVLVTPMPQVKSR